MVLLQSNGIQPAMVPTVMESYKIKRFVCVCPLWIFWKVTGSPLPIRYHVNALIDVSDARIIYYEFMESHKNRNDTERVTHSRLCYMRASTHTRNSTNARNKNK